MYFGIQSMLIIYYANNSLTYQDVFSKYGFWVSIISDSVSLNDDNNFLRRISSSPECKVGNNGFQVRIILDTFLLSLPG